MDRAGRQPPRVDEGRPVEAGQLHGEAACGRRRAVPRPRRTSAHPPAEPTSGATAATARVPHPRRRTGQLELLLMMIITQNK